VTRLRNHKCARHRRRDDQGFTLVELLVVMTLMGLVLGLIATLVSSTLRTSSRARVAATDTSTAATSMDRLTRDLRMAIAPTASTQAFTSASDSDVTFYTALGTEPAPLLVRWWLDAAGVLRRSETRPTGNVPPYTWSGTPNTTSIVARGVVVDVSAPLFRYLNPTNAIVSIGCYERTPAPNPCATPLAASPNVSATDLALVAAVDVRLAVRSSAADSGIGSVQQSRVVIVNRGAVTLPRNR